MRNIFVLGLAIGFLIGLLFGFIASETMIFDSAGLARCKSAGGVYGGGKCFVNGFEVDKA